MQYTSPYTCMLCAEQ